MGHASCSKQILTGHRGTNLISPDDANNTASVPERDDRTILIDHVGIVAVSAIVYVMISTSGIAWMLELTRGQGARYQITSGQEALAEGKPSAANVVAPGHRHRTKSRLHRRPR